MSHGKSTNTEGYRRILIYVDYFVDEPAPLGVDKYPYALPFAETEQLGDFPLWNSDPENPSGVTLKVQRLKNHLFRHGLPPCSN